MQFPSPSKPLTLTAKNAIYLLVSRNRDNPPFSIYEKHADSAISPASIIKLLTAVTAINVAHENGIPISHQMTVSSADDVEGSGGNLKNGDRISFHDALANLLLTSSNVTANLIAREFGEILEAGKPEKIGHTNDRFISAMNSVANNLQMKRSRFLNPHGLAIKGQRSTARDLSALVAHCLRQPLINEIWGKEQKTIHITGPNKRRLTARSVFRQSSARAIPGFSIPQFLGGKSGTFFPSVFNLAAVSEIDTENDIISVTIGSSSIADRFSDYLTLVHLGNSIERP